MTNLFVETDESTITNLLQAEAVDIPMESLKDNQRKDPVLLEMIQYIEEGKLPADRQRARKLVLQTHT